MEIFEKFDPSTTRYTEKFENALVEIQELQTQMDFYAASVEMDPSEIDLIEERVDLIETLKRKYGNNLNEVLSFREDAQEKLNKTENRHGELKRLEGEIDAARSTMLKISEKITKKRALAAPKLGKLVTKELMELGFKKSKFEILLERKDQPTATGHENMEFLFAPNPGEPSKPLRSIASSGEMSRVMLALKGTLAREDSIPVIVFDEIDANVGGEIARTVGTKMCSLGDSHQVISISHLPQVASMAASHFVVQKEFTKDGRTKSQIRSVKNDERVSELARMLGGEKGTAEKHAYKIAKKIKDLKGEISVLSITSIVDKVTPYKYRLKTYSRIFQALRIAANNELDHLRRFLDDFINLLNPGGRIVIISYHSVEDRIVKHKLKELKHKKEIELIYKKPLIPSKEEVSINKRSRSAKMRVGEKIG